MDLPKLYTIKQAAEPVQVHYHTMLGWVTSGEIKSVRVGLRRRITADAIAEFCGMQQLPAELKPAKTTAQQIDAEYEAAKRKLKI